MRVVSLSLVFVVSLSCATNHVTSTVRGELAWDTLPETITECTTGRVYELGVMAISPHVNMGREARRLAAASPEPVLVEIRGTISTPSPSAQRRGTTAVIEMPWVLSMESGRCPSPTA